MSTIDREQLATLGRALASSAEDVAVQVANRVAPEVVRFAAQSLGVPPLVAEAIGRRVEELIKESLIDARVSRLHSTSFIIVDETEAK